MYRIIAMLIMFAAQPVYGLTNMLTWGAANQSTYNSATQCMLVAKGIGNDNLYILEADSSTGALATTFTTQQKTMSYKDRHDYSSVNVTTAAYVELIASTSANIYRLNIFDSSGETLVLATGAAASEVDLFYIFPGGNPLIEVYIASGTRLSIKAVSATASTGEIVINATN